MLIATLPVALFMSGDYMPLPDFMSFLVSTRAGLTMLVIGSLSGGLVAFAIFALSGGATMDWASRAVLAWRLSNTMDVSFCVSGVLIRNGIAISMDGKGSWRDNVFVERLWKSVKYEEVYLRAYNSVGEARASLGRYPDFYNRQRPHSSLDHRTPDEAYFYPSPMAAAA